MEHWQGSIETALGIGRSELPKWFDPRRGTRRQSLRSCGRLQLPSPTGEDFVLPMTRGPFAVVPRAHGIAAPAERAAFNKRGSASLRRWPRPSCPWSFAPTHRALGVSTGWRVATSTGHSTDQASAQAQPPPLSGGLRSSLTRRNTGSACSRNMFRAAEPGHWTARAGPVLPTQT